MRAYMTMKGAGYSKHGGLRKWMPHTHKTFAAAPLPSSAYTDEWFFSKDEILYRAYINHSVNPMARLLKGVRLL